MYIFIESLESMESPFATSNQSFVMYLEPILNSYYKTYQNVITLSIMPSGPLANMVTSMSTTKLSPFQESGAFSSPGMFSDNCVYVLLRYPKQGSGFGGRGSIKHPDYFMGADDIPSVLSWLVSNGYSIDTDITKMLYKSRITIGGVSESRLSGDRKMICMARFLG